MKKTKLAINGFGRIGRNAFKIAFDRDDVEVVAINDLTDTETLAYLLKHDSTYGAYAKEVTFDENHLIVAGQAIRVVSQADPVMLPWKELEVDVVIESTGRFTDPKQAQMHIAAGAKKVVISAPVKQEGASTVVLGVNEQSLASAGSVVSNGSCTTNAITVVADLIERHFGIETAMMTTIHSYTADQRLQDAPHKDLRRSRAAAENIVPTSTGAAVSLTQVIPSLTRRFDGLSFRVPTPVVSVSDFVINTKQDVSVEVVNAMFREAAANPLYEYILAVTDEPLVSSDFIGDPHSAIVDLGLTMVVGTRMLKVVAWYDNEWGYSNRLVKAALLLFNPSLSGDRFQPSFNELPAWQDLRQ